MNHYRLFYKFPRVDHFHSGIRKIPDVASDDGETMSQRGCCDQTINFRQIPIGSQTAPSFSFIETYSKNSPLENRRDFRQPLFKYSGLYRVLGPDLLDTPADLSRSQGAQVMRLCRMITKPGTHRRVRPHALAHFGNHVGIDEEHAEDFQSSAKPWSLRGGLAWRGSFRSKIQSSPSSASPVPAMSSRLLILDSFAWLSASAMAFAKIRRCSSSADTPCAAARNLSDLTSASGMFLTSN